MDSDGERLGNRRDDGGIRSPAVGLRSLLPGGHHAIEAEGELAVAEVEHSPKPQQRDNLAEREVRAKQAALNDEE
jgi:hypothetical protein